MEVLGVFVVSNENGYTGPASKRAESSQYDIILTDIKNLCNDLSWYPLQKIGYEQIKKKINNLIKSNNRLNKRIDELEMQINSNNSNNLLIILLIGVLIGFCITLLLINLII